MSDEFKPGFPTEVIIEGRVKAVVPKLEAFRTMPFEYAPSKAPVFYNPVMEMNRDLTVLAIQAYQRKIKRDISICEPLTGCGLRGIRFAAEIDGAREVMISDINENAYRLACHNVRLNNLSERVTTSHCEANFILTSRSAPRKRFDVVDIDPFGSPVPFLDSAVRALRDKGLVGLTATDMATLCGVHPRACVRKYGGKPLRTEYCHELAVRLLAGCLAATAAKHDIGIDLVFAHRGEHYVRIYASIRSGAKNADSSMRKMGYVLHCFKCLHRELVERAYDVPHATKCAHCGAEVQVSGPLWIGELFNSDFCDSLLREVEARKLRKGLQIRKALTAIKEESCLPATYFVVDSVCDLLGLPVPSVRKVVERLRSHGYSASITHFNSRGLRSEVASSRLMEIMHELM